jgi:hypothetical protein
MIFCLILRPLKLWMSIPLCRLNSCKTFLVRNCAQNHTHEIMRIQRQSCFCLKKAWALIISIIGLLVSSLRKLYVVVVVTLWSTADSSRHSACLHNHIVPHWVWPELSSCWSGLVVVVIVVVVLVSLIIRHHQHHCLTQRVMALGKLTVTQTVKELSAFHGTWRFIVMQTSVCCWTTS